MNLPELVVVRSSFVSKFAFDTLDEVQGYATKRLWFYNHKRPHKATSDGGLISTFNFG